MLPVFLAALILIGKGPHDFEATCECICPITLEVDYGDGERKLVKTFERDSCKRDLYLHHTFESTKPRRIKIKFTTREGEEVESYMDVIFR